MKKLTRKQSVLLASLLFGMLFGAGNLIFPISMGQLAGANSLAATIGFCLTGVGVPLLGIAAIGRSQSEGLFDAGLKVGRKFAYLFTCALYLSIGPLFAIPRTATVSFATGILPFVSPEHHALALFIFSTLFFLAALFFSLRPSRILDWVGKYLNPLFLLLLTLLIMQVVVQPLGNIFTLPPTGKYQSIPFFTGFLKGYETMDGLASLAFAIVLIRSIQSFGLKKPSAITAATLKSGLLTALLMFILYGALTYIGAQATFLHGLQDNGATVLSQLAQHYFGYLGNLILAGIMVFACLKTAIGLICACASTFEEMFPHSLSYRQFALLFAGISFAISNVGLNAILTYSVPALSFLYPITITFIFLLLAGNWFDHQPLIYRITLSVSALFALLDVLFRQIPSLQHGIFSPICKGVSSIPLAELGLGWLLPTLIAFGVAMFWRWVRLRE